MSGDPQIGKWIKWVLLLVVVPIATFLLSIFLKWWHGHLELLSGSECLSTSICISLAGIIELASSSNVYQGKWNHIIFMSIEAAIAFIFFAVFMPDELTGIYKHKTLYWILSCVTFVISSVHCWIVTFCSCRAYNAEVK
jgi:hypothetical protein